MGIGSSIKKAVKKISKGLIRSITNPFKAVGQAMQGDFKGMGKTMIDQTLLTTTGEGIMWRAGENPVRKDAKVADKEMQKRTELYRSSLRSSAKPSGLITQLRQGKGKGGGSYSDIAKNSLGGSTGTAGTFSGRTG